MTRMRWLVAVSIAVSWVAVQAQSPAGSPPPWAYTVNPPSASAREDSSELRRDRAGAASGREGGPAPGAKPAPPDPSPQQVPGTSVSFTIAQTRDAYNPPDWHPDAHPATPASVAHGRPKEMRACGFCHLVNGQGRPENASLAGLPAAYIVQQMADFKSGDRRSAEPRMGPPNAMIQDAKAATDEEIRTAAAYFSSFPYKKWVRVVEAKDVPVTRIAGSMHVPTNTGSEPLGQRIIEMPEDPRRTELRDASSGFVAYVPPGSIGKGEALVKTGGDGKTVACGACHGADLKGLGPIPPLAGRSPSYTVRQLYDLQQGVRKGPWSPLMKAAVEQLTIDDMIAIAAYTASREP